jgi:hypothetical protein
MVVMIDNLIAVCHISSPHNLKLQFQEPAPGL